MSEPKFGETDRTRRERETREAWKLLDVWWEAYKIFLTGGIPNATMATMSISAAAYMVEKEYCERRAKVVAEIVRIWDGYDWKEKI